ncbi:MAG: alpha/beta hydrolase family protein [Terriglobales bacterium]
MCVSTYETFADFKLDPPVRGFIHRPSAPNNDGLVLTHGAGSNCQSSLLLNLAEAFATTGFTVLRCDLPFRQLRPHGPPRPRDSARDREGLKNAVAALRNEIAGCIFLGGHSYGGRQATMLVAAEPDLVSGLILFSYPLHPPRKPEQLRTQHFPQLRTPSMFVHGTRDPFGSIEEMERALKLIPARHELMTVEGAGHDLGFKGKTSCVGLPATVVKEFQNFLQSK